MNPNSQNQRWSKWFINISPGRKIPRSVDVVVENSRRFLRQAFGSASAMEARILPNGDWQFSILSEGHPVHDPTYVAYYVTNLTQFFTIGFGLGTKVHVDTKLMAGSGENGKPPDQMMVLPSLVFRDVGDN